MTEAWISLPSAVKRVRAHGDLSTGAANVRAIEVFGSGLVRTRWDAFEGVRGGEARTRPPIDRHAWASADIPEPDLMVSADGTRRRGITVNEADLMAWLLLSNAPQTAADAPAARLTAEEDARNRIPILVARGLTKADIHAALKSEIRDLQQNEFNRAWFDTAGDEAKKPGRRTNTKPPA